MLIFIGMAVPFKVMVLIPGFTEVRPVNAIPVVVGLLLGPAGAWGCAFGNLAADLFGTFSTASVLGFIGNFIAAYLPYRIWHINGNGGSPNVKTYKNLAGFALISFVSALCVAVVIALGLDIMKMANAKSLLQIIFLNDLGFSLLLGMPVFIVLTSGEFNIKVEIPQTDLLGRGALRTRKFLLSALVLSGLILCYEIMSGAGLVESPVMVVSSIMFVLSLGLFLFRK